MNDYRTAKITEGLTLQALKETFYVGRITVDQKEIFVNHLADAIADGTLDAMVADAADKMHDGETIEVLRALARNLSSFKTNLNKRDFVPNKDIETLRYETLHSFVSERMSLASAKAVNAAGVSTSESYWKWTMEQIQQVSPTDLKLCSSVYNNMHSAKSKYPDKVELDATFDARLAVAAAKFSAAKKLAKTKEHVSPDLINKLAQGKTNLSKAEALALLEVLMSK